MSPECSESSSLSHIVWATEIYLSLSLFVDICTFSMTGAVSEYSVSISMLINMTPDARMLAF